MNFIIHGFAGDTKEIEYLVNYLQKRDLDTHTVLLAGHGSTKKVLSSSSYADWIKSVSDAVEELTLSYSKINFINQRLNLEM